MSCTRCSTVAIYGTIIPVIVVFHITAVVVVLLLLAHVLEHCSEACFGDFRFYAQATHT